MLLPRFYLLRFLQCYPDAGFQLACLLPALDSRLFLPCGSQTASVLADSLGQATRVQGSDPAAETEPRAHCKPQLCLSSTKASRLSHGLFHRHGNQPGIRTLNFVFSDEVL